MKKNLLALAGILLAASAMAPSFARAQAIDGDWADRSEIETLAEDVIYQGEKVSTSDLIAKSTYQLELFNPSLPSFQFPSCTATLIRKDVLITAGHCLPERSDVQILIRYYSAATKSYKKMKVTQIVLHKDFSEKKDARGSAVVKNDLALLRLEKDLPGGKVALLPRADLKLVKGQKVIVAGFGMNGMTVSKEELLKDPAIIALQKQAKAHPPKTEEEIKDFMATLMSITNLKPLLKTESVAQLVDNGEQASMQITGSHSVCSGDSGGPSYLRDKSGRLVIVGVHSTSTNADCKPMRGTFIKEKYDGFDSFVPTYLNWIQSRLSEMKAENI